MARGSIRKRSGTRPKPYQVVVDIGPDPLTGRRRQRCRSYRTRREAEAGLRAWLAEIDRGELVERSDRTVADLLQDWMELHARHHCNATTREGYWNTITVHVVPALGAIPVQKLTAEQVQRFYAAKLAAGAGARTVQCCHQRLRAALAMAVRLGLVARNVTDAVRLPPAPRRERPTWSEEEARRFLAAARAERYWPLWLLALATGLRRGELLGVRWQDIDLDAATLHVRQALSYARDEQGRHAITFGPPKHDSRRALALPPGVVAELRAHRARQAAQRLHLGSAWPEHDLLFTTALGGAVVPQDLDRVYRRLLRAAGVPAIHLHDLRHTHGSVAEAHGASITTIAKRLGHRQEHVTHRYLHADAAQDRALAQAVGEALCGPHGPDSGPP